MKPYIRFVLSAVLFMGQWVPAWAGDDFMEARRLQDLGEILPLQQLLEKIRPRFPGKILGVELEKEDAQIAYEIEILGQDGIVREVYVDASNGRILSVEEDD